MWKVTVFRINLFQNLLNTNNSEHPISRFFFVKLQHLRKQLVLAKNCDLSLTFTILSFHILLTYLFHS